MRSLWHKKTTKKNTMPEAIVSDSHIGTSMWQASMLKLLGIETEIHSLSNHAHYAGHEATACNRLFKNIEALSRTRVHSEFMKSSELSLLRFALCSFPPSRIEAIEKLPESVKPILNIGHRIHIHVPGDRLVQFTEKIKFLADSKRIKLATMSEYDYHYTRYYTGLDLYKLPVMSAHIPETITKGAYNPTNKVILIGPSHNTQTIIGFSNNLDELNRLSAEFAKLHQMEPYTFDFIKSIYPGDTASPEKLSRHPAALINPYSAFSISMIELYQMNIPFFVPSDDLLINQMGDVRLFPIYQSQDSVNALEHHYPKPQYGYNSSPNDTSPESQREWLTYMFFNQVAHAQRWRTQEELLNLIYTTNMSALHAKMQTENEAAFRAQKAAWATFLN